MYMMIMRKVSVVLLLLAASSVVVGKHGRRPTPQLPIDSDILRRKEGSGPHTPEQVCETGPIWLYSAVIVESIQIQKTVRTISHLLPNCRQKIHVRMR